MSAGIEEKIVTALRGSPSPLKALDIAREIKVTRKEVNQVIYHMGAVERANPGTNPPLWRVRQMIESNAEYSTLAICTDMLEIALTGDRDILHFLEQEGYNIPDDVSNPKSMLSPQEKAGLVVTAIKDKVSLNSRNYQKLLDHFHSNERVYGDIITVLEQAYNKLGSHPKDQPSAGYGKTTISQCSISIYQKTKLFFGRFIYNA